MNLSCSINLSNIVGPMLDARVMSCSLSHAGSILRVCPPSPVCDSSLAAFLVPHTTFDLYNFINELEVRIAIIHLHDNKSFLACTMNLQKKAAGL